MKTSDLFNLLCFGNRVIYILFILDIKPKNNSQNVSL